MSTKYTRIARKDDSIDYASSSEVSANPQRPYEWQLDGYLTHGSNRYGANVDLISKEYTGAGVRVGLIDEGFDLRHPDLAGRFDLHDSFDPRDGANSNIMPDTTANVHGTWVAGVLGARDGDGFGMVGVAPDATLVGYFARFGAGGSSRAELSDLLARQVNVDVSNNSWGYSTQFSDNFLDPSWFAMRDAIRLGIDHGRDGLGTVFVFAAGNDRQYTANSLSYDGDNTNNHNLTNSRTEITAAASTPDGHIAQFSTPGASVFVTAPGVSVLSTMLVHGDPAAAFGYVSGTSFAAPIVSGVIAMMLEANSDLGYRDVQEILAISSRVIDPASSSWATNGAINWNGGGHVVSHDFGFGLVDAHAAVRLAETWSTQHTAANESVIGLTGDVGAHAALVDFQPNRYAVDVATDYQSFSVQWVEVDVSIQHSFVGDLRIHLISPTGTDSLLLDRPGSGNNSRDDLHFTLSTNHDWAESPVGTWTLVVEDAGTGGTGAVQSFSVRIYGDDTGNDNTYYYTDDFATLGGDRTTLSDATGRDTINAAPVTTGMTVDLTPGASSTIAGRTILISADTAIENVYGGDGNDILTGNDAGNTLNGGHGNDHLYGRAGSDTLVGGLGGDEMAGGTGNDTYFVDNVGDSIIEHAGEGTDTVRTTITYTLGINVENLLLLEEGGATNGSGNERDNLITGNSFANALAGGAGNDTLEGMGGADTLLGGLGDDTYYIDNPGSVIAENVAEGIDTVIASISYTIAANVEKLTLAEAAGAIDGTGNSLDNVITSNASNNKLDGGTGADILIGGDGSDTYFVHNALTHVVEQAGEGDDTVIADVDYEMPANVETLILSGSATHGTVGFQFRTMAASEGADAATTSADAGGKTLVANASIASTLTGGASADLLIGAHAVATTMSGGDGDDGYVVCNANDKIQERAGGGNDAVFARVNFVLSANVETLNLLGTATDGTGNDAGSVLVANPSLSSTLHGGTGSDLFVGAHDVSGTMIGGAGDDVYVISNSGDVIQENTNGGNDTVYASADYVLSAGVETLYLVGKASHGTASDHGAALVANGELASTLLGGLGNDLFIGSHGAESVLAGGAGDDSYIIFNSKDTIVEGADGGNDTVYARADYVMAANVETMYLAGSASHGTANDTGATLVANGSADSTLTGGAGRDLLVGAHSSVTKMSGGAGDDTFVVYNATDTVREDAGGGNDTVVAFADFTLSGNVETLMLHPSAGAINGTGGATDNLIIGNADNNVIDGGAGADALIGGGGNDTFVFHCGEANGDAVMDFQADGALDHLVFVGYGEAAAGANFTQLDATHWSVNSSDGHVHEIIAFNNAANIHAQDFLFA